MDRDHKLTVFLDSLGADADVGVAVEVLEAHNWDLAAAMESVTGPGQGQGCTVKARHHWFLMLV